MRGRRSNSISSVEFAIKDIEREAIVKEVLEIYASADINEYCPSVDSGEDNSLNSSGSDDSTNDNLEINDIIIDEYKDARMAGK